MTLALLGSRLTAYFPKKSIKINTAEQGGCHLFLFRTFFLLLRLHSGITRGYLSDVKQLHLEPQKSPYNCFPRNNCVSALQDLRAGLDV